MSSFVSQEEEGGGCQVTKESLASSPKRLQLLTKNQRVPLLMTPFRPPLPFNFHKYLI